MSEIFMLIWLFISVFVKFANLKTFRIDQQDNFTSFLRDEDDEWNHSHSHHPHHHSTVSVDPTNSIFPTSLITSSSISTSTKYCPFPQCLKEKIISFLNKTITWPDTKQGESATSEPLCLDNYFKIIKRTCSGDGSGWEKAPLCSRLQEPINPCPKNFLSISDRYCYIKLNKTTFPPPCPYPEMLSWDEYKHLDIIPEEPIWMPVNRNISDSYGIDIYRFIESSPKFMDPFRICTTSCKIFFYNKTFMDKPCLIYHNYTHVEAVACNEKHAALCVYNTLKYQNSGLCGQKLDKNCKKSDYSMGAPCICKTTIMPLTDGNNILAEFLKPYQNFIFPDSNCRIGLTRSDDNDNSSISFIWSSGQLINYSYWAPNVNFEQNYGILTKDGWILENTENLCNLFVLPFSIDGKDYVEEPKMQLKMDNENYILEIHSYKKMYSLNNKDPLIYCFTDADAKSTIYRITEFFDPTFDDNDKENEIYTVKFPILHIDQSGPGNYWCEGLSLPRFKFIKSKIEITKNISNEYVVLSKIKNYEDVLKIDKSSEFPLTPENIEMLQILFRNELPRNITFYPRIFKINGVDEIKKEINITFHLTSSIGSSSAEELELISKFQRSFELLDFRNTEYCPIDKTTDYGQSVIWPSTPLNSKISPLNGYCVTSKVTFITRKCVGNFIDGAHWEEFDEMCYFYAKSELTNDLINITDYLSANEPLENRIEKLLQISEKYDKFNTLDFVLAVKFLEEISEQLIDLNLLTDIINNFMSISRVILSSAQLNFHSTDILIESLDKILEHNNFDQFIKPHFSVVSFNLKSEKIFGLQLENCSSVGNNCTIQPIKDSTNFLNYFSISSKKIVASINLSEQLYQQILNYANTNSSYEPKLTISIFYGSTFFIELDNLKSGNIVFGILLPEFNQKFNGPVIIRYFTNGSNNLMENNCSYWKFNNFSGSWIIEEDVKTSEEILCKSDHTTHFALVSLLQNVTTDLEEILESNLTSLEKLKQVDAITNLNRRIFVPVDIFLISQIITKSLDEGPIPLLISKIISRLFKVPRSVLRASQEHHSATDLILYSVDKMAKMSNELELHYANFSVIVKDLTNNKITGLILSNCKNDQCDIEYLKSFTNISQYTSNNSISALIIFSEKLIEQIMKNSPTASKIIITIYYNDAFFNENGTEKNTSIIFGIVFPDLKEKLNGNITIVYNLESKLNNDSNQCSYWNYQVDPLGNSSNITIGKWIDESFFQSQNLMGICTYNHVTHFGMLISNNEEFDDDLVLNLITDIGCILSLSGIFIIFLTSILIKKWRQNTGNRILVHFSLAISLKIITLYTSVYVKKISFGIYCTITGAILHYAILSESGWMLAIAILQFKRFVEVLGGPPQNALIKALICGWIFPIFPVIILLTIDYNNYEIGLANLCYPSNLGLYLAVWLPVLIVLIINCGIFIYIIFNVFHRKTEYIDSGKSELFFQWRLAFLLFFLLGINTIFGFLGQIKNDAIFTYLYSISASVQGFILFIFFIPLNKDCRNLYSQTIKQWFYTRGMFKVWHTKSKN